DDLFLADDHRRDLGAELAEVRGEVRDGRLDVGYGCCGCAHRFLSLATRPRSAAVDRSLIDFSRSLRGHGRPRWIARSSISLARYAATVGRGGSLAHRFLSL